jgi:hypothetical protein
VVSVVGCKYSVHKAILRRDDVVMAGGIERRLKDFVGLFKLDTAGITQDICGGAVFDSLANRFSYELWQANLGVTGKLINTSFGFNRRSAKTLILSLSHPLPSPPLL